MVDEVDPIVYYSRQELEANFSMDDEMDNYLRWLIIIKFKHWSFCFWILLISKSVWVGWSFKKEHVIVFDHDC